MIMSNQHRSNGRINHERLTNVLVYFLATLVAVIVGLAFYRGGDDWTTPLSVGMGASVTLVIGAWLVNWLIWLPVMHFKRGAPFDVGCHVEITHGQYKGAMGEVQAKIEGFYAVKVVLLYAF